MTALQTLRLCARDRGLVRHVHAKLRTFADGATAEEIQGAALVANMPRAEAALLHLVAEGKARMRDGRYFAVTRRR